MITSIAFVSVFFYVMFGSHLSFLEQQLQYERVRTAFEEKQAVVVEMLHKNQLKTNNLNLLLVAFKAEQQLVIYAKSSSDKAFKPLVNYNICRSSGKLGPKRREGDLQVPEGFYHIDRFNPVSDYHLSLGINYPNASDSLKEMLGNLGGDIFIHGACVTIGCLPMTDDLMKEIYPYAVHAKNSGQATIPVYIFPFDMTDATYQSYRKTYENDPDLLRFWANLKQGYDQFTQSGQALNYSVAPNGDYAF
ncbi:MAG: hypothetical protein U0X91_31090 [Spirosomataceae bacterium]